ncbi:hypothetical protein [Klebsiella sp. 141240]|uniref:hypothetical protein n=1 Tax=Klebsiella sp. 141240 TaxID=3020034 RepID=UPI003D33E6EE
MRRYFVGWRLTPYPTYGHYDLPNVFTALAETAGVGSLKIPGGAAAYRGYSTMRFGSPEKAQRAASGKTS